MPGLLTLTQTNLRQSLNLNSLKPLIKSSSLVLWLSLQEVTSLFCRHSWPRAGDDEELASEAETASTSGNSFTLDLTPSSTPLRLWGSCTMAPACIAAVWRKLVNVQMKLFEGLKGVHGLESTEERIVHLWLTWRSDSKSAGLSDTTPKTESSSSANPNFVPKWPHTEGFSSGDDKQRQWRFHWCHSAQRKLQNFLKVKKK